MFGGDVDTDQTANRARVSLAAFSQQQELAADKEGIMIAGKAGYDPHAAARFLGAMGRFAKFSAGDAEQGDDFLSSHPSTPDRIQKAIETARAFFGAPGIGETDRAGYMAAIDGIVFGDSPQQGAIVGRRFIHPALEVHLHRARGLHAAEFAGRGGRASPATARRCASTAPKCPTTHGAQRLSQVGLDRRAQAGDGQGRVSYNGIEMASAIAATEQWNFRVVGGAL